MVCVSAWLGILEISRNLFLQSLSTIVPKVFCLPPGFVPQNKRFLVPPLPNVWKKINLWKEIWKKKILSLFITVACSDVASLNHLNVVKSNDYVLSQVGQVPGGLLRR